MENEQEEWDRHLKAIEIARSIVREEAEKWRESLGIEDGGHGAAGLAMEMQLFAMSLRAPMSAGGIDTVEFFCELTDVDFSHIMEVMNNAISYGLSVVEAGDTNGHA